MTRTILAGFVSAFALCTALAFPASAQDKLRLIIFQSATALANYVAEDNGLYKKHGLDVEITPTPSSTFMMTGLADGKFDIAASAIDNFIAYNEGQTKAKTQNKPDFVVFLGGTSQDLPLVVSSDIKTFADLKGKPIGVDAPNTAFAFVFYKMLEQNGVSMDDYKIVAVGGTTKRWSSLQDGSIKAAMLSEAYVDQAKSKNFRVLGTSHSVIGDYQGSAYGAQRSWADKNRALIVRYIRAYLEGVEWAHDPKNHASAAESLRKRIKGMSEQGALATVRKVTSGVPGALARDGKISEAGLKTVVDLRRQYGTPKKEIGDPSRYFDLSYYQDAMKK